MSNGIADSAVGAILHIDDDLLTKIKSAEGHIKSLQATSATAAQKIKGHFDNTAVSGLNAFIRKVEDAKNRLGNISMPTIDATGFATSISQIAQAMATVDRSATTGANRLSRIADSITKLSAAQPNPQLFQDIANGISAIGNMSQQTIANVSQLAQSMAQLARDIRTVQNAQRAQANDTATAAQYNKLYKEQADLTRKINEIKGKGSSADARDLTILSKMQDRWREISDQIDKLNRKKQTAASVLAQFAGANRVGDAQSRTTVSGAINYAKQAKSLKELQDAYKNLKQVMQIVDPKSKDWQQMNVVLQQTKTKIDSIRKAMGEFQNQSRMTGDSLGKLKGQLAAAFSIGAIMGYIKKMVEVRGEFELQNVALRAILQNKDEADKIFMQVQNMALQSPFSIMQMTTFTKQLAAYRIESEKLVGTTKMLADVSAGLGVDMGRLILAYGQVRSANYLRATEIRQFTEAGLNIAGELAQYFSELQGKMVSVGDVMEMVTKRMVRFEDVEEVFKRVTSAGGLFYDMQKKQSNTISGMLQRITDAWQIMLNDIGKSNQGIIRDALDLIRQMISHWRMLVPIIKTVGGAMALVFATKGIMAAVKGVRDMQAAIIHLVRAYGTLAMAQRAASIASWATGIGAVISILGLVAGAIAGARAEANKLNEELERIGTESFDDMNTSIANYIKLADTIRSTNVSYTERQEAIEELNRTYKDILPTYLKEREYIDGNADSYATATKKIKEYYQAKEYQKKVESIKSGNDYTKMLEHLKGLGERMIDYGWFDKEVPKAMVSSFMEQLANEFISGETEASMDAVIKRMQEYFGDRLHKEGKFVKWWGQDFSKGSLSDMLGEAYGMDDLEDALDRMNKITDKVKEAQFGLTTAASMEEQYTAAAKMHAQEVIDGAQKQVNEINAQIQAYFTLKTELEKLKAKGQWSAEEKERMVALQGKIGQASASFFKMANSVIPGLDKAFLSNISNVFDLESALDSVSQKAFPTLAAQGANALKPVKGEVDALTQALNMLLTQLGIAGQLAGNKGPYTAKDAPMMLTPEEQQKWADEQNEIWRKEQQTLQDRVRERKKSNQEILQDEAKRFGIENALADKQILIQERTNKEYANDLRALAKQKEETLKDWDAGDSRARKLMGYTDAEIAQMRNEIKFLQAVAKEYDPYDDKAKKKGGKDEIAELWKNRLKAIQDFYKRYEELRKHFNEEESLSRAKDAFTPLFKTLEMNINDVISKGMGKQGLALNLEEMTKEVAKVREKLVDEFQKATADTQIQVDFKIKEDSENKLKQQLDEMFDSYDLSMEFKKAGINVDLIYMLGGKPTTLQDIRNELERLRKEGGGSADAENRIKTLEEAEKKLTQIELKEQKERLKNYEKYLKQMYSDRAKKMIEAYTDMKNMEQDFNSFIAKLQAEANQDGTTDERKQQIAEQIKSLKFQKAEAIKAVNEALNQNLAKLDWEQFKGSDVFTQLYQDTENLSKKGIDLLIKKLEDARTALQSMEKVDYRAVREITNHIEKLQDVRLDTSSWGELTTIIKKAKETIGDVSLEDAQKNMVDAQSKIDAANIEIAQIQAIIDLKEQEGNKDDKIKNLSEEQQELYDEDIDALRDKLATQQDIVKGQQAEVDKNEKIVDSYDTQRNAIKKKIAIVDQLKQDFDKVYQSVVDVADALGNDTDMWGDFGQAIADSVFSCITLTLQMQLLGIAANSALGIIGWVATALQVVANLFVSIFRQHDKRLEKQITRIQDRVDTLSKSFEKLEKSIERAFSIGNENRLTEQALDNIEEQKRAYQEMIRLEESKKKTDKGKIKDYKEKLAELDETLEEMYEKRREKWGSTNDVWSEANNWVDAWLDAYKETGDGLDALNDSWDEFYENLVKKQAASKVLGTRMDSWIKQINDTIDASIGGSMSELDIIDAYKRIGNEIRADMDAVNVGFKEIFKYAGIDGGSGSLILSDLQKGIQNITEPQAAAIEAYLNSMRFAVFRHTEQLDTLIATIQMQYGSGAENPVVTELKGIRGVLDNIYRDLHSVVKSGVGKTYIQVG